MKFIRFVNRIIKLFGGTFLFAFGLVFIMKANMGYGPWELFHAGLTKVFRIFTLGQMTTIMSALVVLTDWLLKEKIGFGTLVNMFMMGTFMDVFLKWRFLPNPVSIAGSAAVLIAGFLIVSVGIWIYISSGFGAGPRDSLMVAVRRKTGMPIGMSRGIIETTAALLGWALGGPIGVGTVIAIVGQGFFIQFVFRIVRFEPTSVKHETFRDTGRTVAGLFRRNDGVT